jgi:hypothetical protein
MNAAVEEMQTYVSLIPPAHIESAWPSVEEYLLPAVERSNGRWTMEALKQWALQNEKQVWIVFDDDKTIHCVAVTQNVIYPASRMLSIEFLGGTGLNQWAFKLLDVLNNWAKDSGCNGIEATARIGFWKWLEKDGFDKAYTVFEKRFNP